jgi:hypothetical protein
MTSPDPAMPKIGTHVKLLEHGSADSGVYRSAVVVGQLNDPVLGDVVELRLSDSRRMQRTWPTSTIRLA